MTGDDGGRCAVAAAGVLLGAEPIASEAESYQRFQVDLEAIGPMRKDRRWSKWTRHARDTRSFFFFCGIAFARPPFAGRLIGLDGLTVTLKSQGQSHVVSSQDGSFTVRPCGMPLLGPWQMLGQPRGASHRWGDQPPTAHGVDAMPHGCGCSNHLSLLTASFRPSWFAREPLFAHSGKRQCGQGGITCATPSR